MATRYAVLMLWVFSVALGSNAGFAKEPAPCHQDIEKFCKDLPPGRAVNQCMKKHNAELSSSCKQHMQERKQKATAFKIACGQDSKKFCKDAKRGQGSVVRCLRAHETELSAQCKANVAR